MIKKKTKEGGRGRRLFDRGWKNILWLSAGIVIVISGGMLIWISTFKIPDFRDFNQRKVVNSTKIYDRTGKILLYDLHQDVKRTDISFAQMGWNIKNATVAVEDSNFWNNSGVRITSIIRAALVDIFGPGGNTQGGSTITQQLVKNSLLTQKKTIARKMKEWILAIEVDNSMSKESILEAYLNEIPYGGNIYGIEEAAKTYFNEDAQALTLAQAAYLAAIPQSPTYLSPYGSHLDKLEERKNFVLRRMLDLKFITPDQYQKALEEKVQFVPQADIGIKAPHFVFFIKSYLEDKYGSEALRAGLKVTTTLDYNLEQKAEEIVKQGALENQKKYNSDNAGLVAIDPKTGQILAMVGSRDYFDKSVDGNYNVALARRQPGSSFKPFVYATAFEKGFTPSTVLFDLPTEFSTTCTAEGVPLPGYTKDSCYMPRNFDNKYLGPVSLRDALAQSRNIPSVKLFYLAGVNDSIKTAKNMGITTIGDPGRYGLTLVIGGGEVTLLDMTSAYSAFATGGTRNAYTGILKVEDASGKILEEYSPNPVRVLPENTALTISDILSDNKARIPTFGANSVLQIPGREVAVKTGTTNNEKDAWTIGYTPDITVGVWAGNTDNSPTKGSSATLAGPIWNKFMTYVLKDMPNDQFAKPDLAADPETIKPVLRGKWQGDDNFFIDKISGKLATKDTPPETKEEKVITNVHSILYWVDKKNITGPPPQNPGSDPQFYHWEAPVEKWWRNNEYRYPIVTLNQKPTSYDDIHTPANSPGVVIQNPNENSVYSENQKIDIKIQSSGRFPLQKVDVFVNNSYLGSSGMPFGFSFIPSGLENLGDINTLKLLYYDSVYNRGESTVVFKVSMPQGSGN